MKIDKHKKFKFAPLQGDYARANLSESDVKDLNTLVVQINGQTYRKSEAVLKIFGELGSVWAPFKSLLIVPVSLRDKAYDLVASNRYRIYGKKETCRLPTPEERARFLM